MIEEKIIKQLIKKSLEARNRAYAPYSGYKVGAAVYTGDGSMYSGCNIENATYGATNCAERTAIFKAVSEGERLIRAIAITGGYETGDELEYAYPCGICRQVISEFADGDTVIIVAVSEEDYRVYKVEELLPEAFALKR
ncbi:MAG: cytidine deaminase [Coprococcus sp.]|jgi:cytidine deaminase|uniref:cytidine deaminase n=1 Tax=Coprococcus sp. OM04-5BH TaxID=2293093 RepID=UPI000E51C4D2|nr:cytidine deaminase [Coprococcus sp. OM04-5BH]MEE0035231.1 cytidine deaminase [Coprococcus sp.]RHV30295.1 cytidine deaminase [Coprococcus sp. OM04-5BH]